jgi:amidase/aspartyl-tRNA(Asn)/glutamyl-tRNA(Gln) amidotransferase subunit A
MSDLAYQSLTQLARDIATKQVSPVEVMDATIERIDRRNPSLNAVVVAKFDEARDAARRAADDVAAGRSLGPLHGVPTLIKDLFDFKPGWPATFGGIPSMRDFTMDASCTFAERVEAAGAIVIGKTNSPLLGFRGTCDNPLFGPTSNPYDTTRNSGGSSGGSAAAVADGLVTFAEGTDGGGSIRIPSSWCGVFGFQSSAGQVPTLMRPNAFGGVAPFVYEGPITRSVADAELVLSVLRGVDTRDPFSRPPVTGPARDGSFAGLRIGLSIDLGIYPVDPGVAEVIEQACRVIEQAGGTVVPVQPVFPADQGTLADLWSRMISVGSVGLIAGMKAAGIDMVADNADVWPEAVRRACDDAENQTTLGWIQDSILRSAVYDTYQGIFADVDVLLTPTVAVTAVKNAAQRGETLGPTSVAGVPVDPCIGWCLTYLTNFTGHPSASIPAGQSNGLPVGLLVTGSRYGDDDVLAFCRAFEKIMPWSDSYRVCADRAI